MNASTLTRKLQERFELYGWGTRDRLDCRRIVRDAFVTIRKPLEDEIARLGGHIHMRGICPGCGQPASLAHFRESPACHPAIIRECGPRDPALWALYRSAKRHKLGVSAGRYPVLDRGQHEPRAVVRDATGRYQRRMVYRIEGDSGFARVGGAERAVRRDGREWRVCE